LTADNSKAIANIVSKTDLTDDQRKQAVDEYLKKQGKSEVTDIINDKTASAEIFKATSENAKGTNKDQIIANANALF
jgi:ethanolamine utilization protein EutP (predicted NTPase)